MSPPTWHRSKGWKVCRPGGLADEIRIEYRAVSTPISASRRISSLPGRYGTRDLQSMRSPNLPSPTGRVTVVCLRLAKRFSLMSSVAPSPADASLGPWLKSARTLVWFGMNSLNHKAAGLDFSSEWSRVRSAWERLPRHDVPIPLVIRLRWLPTGARSVIIGVRGIMSRSAESRLIS